MENKFILSLSLLLAVIGACGVAGQDIKCKACLKESMEDTSHILDLGRSNATNCTGGETLETFKTGTGSCVVIKGDQDVVFARGFVKKEHLSSFGVSDGQCGKIPTPFIGKGWPSTVVACACSNKDGCNDELTTFEPVPMNCYYCMDTDNEPEQMDMKAAGARARPIFFAESYVNFKWPSCKNGLGEILACPSGHVCARANNENMDLWARATIAETNLTEYEISKNECMDIHGPLVMMHPLCTCDSNECNGASTIFSSSYDMKLALMAVGVFFAGIMRF